MQVNLNSATTFTSVVPIKVFIDNKEAIDPSNIQKGCRKLVETLSGPINTAKGDAICKKFARYDNDYNYYRAVKGYKVAYWDRGRYIKKTASNFFRYINRNNKNFLITGPQAETLAEYGKSIGETKSVMNQSSKFDCYELMAAKKAYGNLIDKYINIAGIRIREGIDVNTRKKCGNETFLNIFLTSNKKYGKSTFKMELEDITFIPFPKK